MTFTQRKQCYMNTERFNVLFLTCDDLRPSLGCFADPHAATPHLDRFATEGMRFERNYCQVPICNPSRSSYLTGRRPDTTRVWTNAPNKFREALPDVVTLPQYFKEHGYHTQSVGKVFCNFCPDPVSWTVPEFDQKHSWFHKYAVEKPKTDAKGVASECAAVPDEAFPDGKVANAAVEALAKIKDRPFFLGVGFWKPHMPYNAPQKHWDLYDRSELATPLPAQPPVHVPARSIHDFRELRAYQDVPDQGPLSPELIARLRHGFYAAVSHLDAMVGRVLEALDANGLADRTIVVFMPDHGIHMGEQGLWSKGTLFELDVNVPLIVRYPGQNHRGTATRALTESIDMHPTVIDLAGLPQRSDLEGTSLRPVLEDPACPWKRAAFSQRARFAQQGDRTPQTMQISIRTDRWRLSEWIDWETKEPFETELYDYSQEAVETVNVAGNPENSELISDLRRQLNAGWKVAMPGHSHLRRE